jgi:hypothetical protein
VLRPKQYGVTGTSCHQLHAAQDERAHQDSADLGIDLDKRGDLRALELHHIASGAHAHLKQRASTGNHVRFAGELPWTVAHYQLLVDPFTPNDVELTVDDDERRDILVACLDKDLAGFDLSAAAVRRDSGDLIAGELRKQLIRATDRWR